MSYPEYFDFVCVCVCDRICCGMLFLTIIGEITRNRNLSNVLKENKYRYLKKIKEIIYKTRVRSY